MPKSLLERIEALVAKGPAVFQQHALIEKNQPQPQLQKRLPNDVAVQQLFPVCSAAIRVLPNAVLRGGLFGVIEKGKRKYEKNVLKATVNSITVKYTGEQLDQADLDVWAECIHRCRGLPIGEKIFFSSYSFLKCIGRNTGKSQHEWLKSSLSRLQVCVVELGNGRFFYRGQLLHDWYRNEQSGENIVILNSKIAPFFSGNFWTGLSIELRSKLRGKPLAQWLHGFYSTHEKPFGYKTETILRLCGSEVSTLWKFRQMLKKSLTDLSKITGWQCLIDENDLVQVKKK